MSYVLTSHALAQVARRGIALRVLQQVLRRPEQRFPQRPGRDILQSRIRDGDRTRLVRVIVDLDRDPVVVVTAYRTANVRRYWRDTP